MAQAYRGGSVVRREMSTRFVRDERLLASIVYLDATVDLGTYC